MIFKKVIPPKYRKSTYWRLNLHILKKIFYSEFDYKDYVHKISIYEFRILKQQHPVSVISGDPISCQLNALLFVLKTNLLKRKQAQKVNLFCDYKNI